MKPRSASRLAADSIAWVLSLCAACAAFAQPELPGMTYESLGELPRFGGWWEFRGEPFSVMLERNPPPLRPADLDKLRAARANPDADPDPLRFCRPPQFMGASGDLPFNLEILLSPGRVTITNEGGLIRRIYTDGRALPADVVPSSTGFSVGKWEGETLVVETVGIEPTATFPPRTPGGTPIGGRVKITERISLEGDDTLMFDVTVDAPQLFTAPDRRRIPFVRSEQTAASEIDLCAELDRAIEPTTGLQRFDMTPPADLPPPPAR
jgi:hypothetical protein